MKTAVTDPHKVRRNDPGRPEICLVFTYHQKFNAGAAAEIEAGCRSGALGCVDCKLKAAAAIAGVLAPIRENRAHFEAHPGEVAGDPRGRRTARAGARRRMTMAEACIG